MSDGPFACIRMRKPWRDLLEKADNRNFGHDDLVRDLRSCVQGDWGLDIAPSHAAKVFKIIRDAGQASLFGNESVDQLRGLINEAESAMARLLTECAMQSIRDGHVGEEGVEETANNMLTEWLGWQHRGVEEHCVNKNVDRARALDVRGRLNKAAREALLGLGRELCGLDAPAEKGISRKQSGLDDGVPINGDP